MPENICSKVKYDSAAEKEMGKFLDEYFYKSLTFGPDSLPVKCRRVFNQNQQQSGIDIILSFNNRNIRVDEKAAFYYSNCCLDTFAFELNSFSTTGENIKKGWFIDQSLQTDYYMLIWPNLRFERDGDSAKRIDIINVRKKDILSTEALFISKHKINLFLQSFGYTLSDLCNISDFLRLIETNKEDWKDNQFSIDDSRFPEQLRKKPNNDIKFVKSPGLKECSCNLLIKKDKLIQISDVYYVINRYGHAVIK